jgi:hypothetical protein
VPVALTRLAQDKLVGSNADPARNALCKKGGRGFGVDRDISRPVSSPASQGFPVFYKLLPVPQYCTT